MPSLAVGSLLKQQLKEAGIGSEDSRWKRSAVAKEIDYAFTPYAVEASGLAIHMFT